MYNIICSIYFLVVLFLLLFVLFIFAVDHSYYYLYVIGLHGYDIEPC